MWVPLPTEWCYLPCSTATLRWATKTVAFRVRESFRVPCRARNDRSPPARSRYTTRTVRYIGMGGVDSARRITCAIAIHNARVSVQELKRYSKTETSLAHTPDVTRIVCNRPVRSHPLIGVRVNSVTLSVFDVTRTSPPGHPCGLLPRRHQNPALRAGALSRFNDGYCFRTSCSS